jgi:hypothetical protein
LGQKGPIEDAQGASFRTLTNSDRALWV